MCPSCRVMMPCRRDANFMSLQLLPKEGSMRLDRLPLHHWETSFCVRGFAEFTCFVALRMERALIDAVVNMRRLRSIDRGSG